MAKSRTYFLFVTVAVTLLAVPFASAANSPVTDTYHLDGRSTVKVDFEPDWDAPAGLRAEALAHEFVVVNAQRYGLPADPADLEMRLVKHSLLGDHFHFQQLIDGIEVEGAQIIVSIAEQGGHVYRVYNNTYPVKAEPAVRAAVLDEQAAYDIAWQRLRAHSDLTWTPQSELVYTPVADGFRLNYVVDLHLEEPDGAWQLYIDAASGEVVSLADSRLPRLKTEPTEIPLDERIDEYAGEIWDREAVFDRRAQLDADADAARKAGDDRAEGTGIVFDPDPRTTLRDNSLQDNSPPQSFNDAYRTRDLHDLEYSGGLYRLNGPWIEIINFEAPHTAPSTTSDGNWTAVRGNNAFNDALTYFHIDQNQRYMQSLGFVGMSAIQDGPIGTDTDGLNGADNSHYIPGSNRMAFGHGCVDDSEDADVVLHEYGHGIQHDIVSSWSGGDTGAMGEGFGDYWAGSYSYGAENGDIFYPNWVFTWDGHGQGNQCWPGRILNAHGAQYVHTTYYGAHQGIPGGYQSDELWSTPLFQTMLTVTDMGYPKTDLDTIILESHFGIGSGLKMRDMANITIATAQTLFPGEPHADVYVEKFLVHNIILQPEVVLAIGAVTIDDPGDNDAADPGETVDMYVYLENDGTLGATAVSATLNTTDPLISITQANAAFPDLAGGGHGENAIPFTFVLDEDFVCGDPIALQLVVTYTDATRATAYLDIDLNAGTPLGASHAASPELAIPDDNAAGITNRITISGTSAVVSPDFNIDINITHTWIGDLKVHLTSPSGTGIYLHNQSGSSADDIIGNYPNTLTPAQSLSAFFGQPLAGSWTLRVSDHAAQDTGVLHSWGINDDQGWECENVITAVAPDRLPTQFGLAQNHPNPFNPATIIAFAVPADAGVVSLRIFDTSGRLVRTLHDGALAPGHYSRTWQGRDNGGRRVASGTYFYRLTGKDFSESRKMIVIQ